MKLGCSPGFLIIVSSVVQDPRSFLCYNRVMNQFFQDYVSRFRLEEFAKEGVSKLFSLLLLWGIFSIAKFLIHHSVQRVLSSSFRFAHQDKGRQKTVLRLVENLLNYLLYFIVLYSVLTILGLPVSSLLAGAGIAGVAIGMGAQGFLSDLVNGFFILLEHQFDVGDMVRLTNGPITISGRVVSVGIRTTQVRDSDGTLHFIPNRNILVVSNQSRGDMRAQIDLLLPTTVDLERVYQLVRDVHQRELPQHPDVTDCVILGPQMDASGQFSFRIHLFVANGQQSKIYHLFYGFYQEALLQAGIALQTSHASL